MRVPRAAALMLLAAGAGALAAPAIEPGQYALCATYPRLAPPPATLPAGAAPVVVEADRGSARENGLSHFSGDVVVTQGDRRLWADVLDYDQPANRASGSGNLRFASPDLSLAGARGTYDFGRDRGSFFDDVYELPGAHGRGKAARVETYASDRTGLYDFLYTTCPRGNQDWGLHAQHLVLDHDTEIGYAYNAWLTFKGVPFLWTPYLSFPLTDRRKSGFLAPSISQSSENGLDLEVPWYWNIAPNMDATFTPRILTRRGTMFMNTYRYLFPGSSGLLHVEYLPHDRELGKPRGLFQYRDHTRLFSHWNLSTSLEFLSDDDYLRDFGTDLAQV
ncbi:MAG TPA: putative LPS assembly protein LptD, partial [Gammaproteobacteria bacterium]|nr:putative LPS assembly protein LptD [Gammaproteobacteria bacterium]